MATWDLVLDSSRPSQYTQAPFAADGVAVINYSGYPLYVRKGDDVVPSSTNFHHLVPPSSGMLIPGAGNRKFSFNLSIAIFAGFVPVAANRADVIIFANEPNMVPPSFTLPAATNAAAFSLTGVNNAQLIVDTTGARTLLLTFVQTSATGNFPRILIELGNTSAGPWTRWRSYRIITGPADMPIFVRSFPITVPFVRVTVFNSGAGTIAGNVYFSTSVYVVTYQGFYTKQIFNFTAAPLTGLNTVISLTEWSGVLRYMTAELDTPSVNNWQLMMQLSDQAGASAINLEIGQQPAFSLTSPLAQFGLFAPYNIYRDGRSRYIVFMPLDAEYRDGLIVQAQMQVGQFTNGRLAIVCDQEA